MNLKRSTIAGLAALTLLLAACGSDAETTTATGGTAEQAETSEMAETTRLWIKSDLVECEGVAPQMCMQVAESAEGPFEFFYDGIDGFEFSEGTSYVVDVVIEEIADPPADGSSVSYTLVEIVEQTPAG